MTLNRLNWQHAIGRSDYGPTTRAVAFGLGVFMNGSGQGRPAKATIAQYVGRSVKTVERHLNTMEADGYLRITRTGGLANEYAVAIPTYDTQVTHHLRHPDDAGKTAAPTTKRRGTYDKSGGNLRHPGDARNMKYEIQAAPLEGAPPVEVDYEPVDPQVILDYGQELRERAAEEERQRLLAIAAEKAAA